jgi:5-methylcytosine-specific restriction endonuclease McrA
MQTLCGLCLYNKYKVNRKPLQRIGKIARQWIDTRREWIKQNPEPWQCYICGIPLDINTMTLDHVVARTRDPSLRFELKNLAPCCYKDNNDKGSLSLEQYLEKKEKLNAN